MTVMCSLRKMFATVPTSTKGKLRSLISNQQKPDPADSTDARILSYLLQYYLPEGRGTSVESGSGAVSCGAPMGLARRSVSTPCSSNRTCRSPASGSRTRRHAFTHGGLRPSPPDAQGRSARIARGRDRLPLAVAWSCIWRAATDATAPLCSCRWPGMLCS